MTIIGLDRLQRTLTHTIPAAVKARVKEAMAKSADDVVAAMKRLAPVETGDLQMSISWTWGDAPRGTIALASRAVKGSDLRITIYAGGKDAYYARFIEFGTNPHINGGLFKGSRHPGSKAQPFFYPGWRMTRRKAKGRITRGIRKAIKESAS